MDTPRTAAQAGTLTRAAAPGSVLILGGVVTTVSLSPIGSLRFYWLPLFIGLTYVCAAATAGARRPLWTSGTILTVFGLEALLTMGDHVRGVPLAPGEVLALGIAVVTLTALHRAGVTVDVMTIGTTILLLGVVYYGADKGWAHGWFVKPAVYGGLLAAYGLVDILLGARAAARSGPASA